MNDSSRRQFLGLTGAAAAAWLGTDPMAFWDAVSAARRASTGGPVQFDVFTAEQAEDLDALAEQILPADDLPGAHDARVVVYIDRALGSFQSQMKDPIIDGVADLNRRGGARYSTLSDARQKELVTEIEETPFFSQIRIAVLVGMVANPAWGGNYDEAGWRMLGFVPRFRWRPPFGDYDAEVMER
jgi:gluconate 2-dehydrogenase gamma chain